MITDTRMTHGWACYCDLCVDTAGDWYIWRDAAGNAGGSRYWLLAHALADKPAAEADGCPYLWYQGPDGETRVRL